nr:ATP-binding cassette domain-containing protein [Desulfobacterales bacterium]
MPFFPRFNVAQNIGFGLRFKKISQLQQERKIYEISQFLGIDHLLDRRPGTLSGGEKQRVALARALVLRLELVLLDEPLSSLDAITAQKLLKELKKINHDFKKTIIHVTHNLSEPFCLAHEIAVMSQGDLIQFGSPEELRRRPVNSLVARFMGIENIFPCEICDNKLFSPDLGVIHLDKIHWWMDKMTGICGWPYPTPPSPLRPSEEKILFGKRR